MPSWLLAGSEATVSNAWGEQAIVALRDPGRGHLVLGTAQVNGDAALGLPVGQL